VFVEKKYFLIKKMTKVLLISKNFLLFLCIS